MSVRSSSEAPSASDASSDLYAEVDTTVQQPHVVSSARSPIASPTSDQMYDNDHDDSPVPSPVQIKGKRRLGSEEMHPAPVKRRKLVLAPENYFSPVCPPNVGLPGEVWQHVFLYLTPDDLSRCLRVCRNFRYYLTQVTASMSTRLPHRRNGLKLVDAETIWTSARKLFALNLPRPLAGFSEMHMFQLLGGRDCQACGRMPKPIPRPTNPFNAGPGADGVRIVWSFAARLCGLCFEATSMKDVQVLVSPAAPLREGLPHAFCTADLHYIPPTLQPQAANSIKGAMSKVYSRKHIDDLQQEHQNAMEFGEAAAEEWVKGLPLLGKQQMADAARWERWEALLPLGSDVAKVLREYFRPSSSPLVDEVVPVPDPQVKGTSLPVPPPTQMKHPLPARVVAAGTAPSAQKPAVNGGSPQQPTKTQWKPPRTPKEVNEAKAIRRAEIERRCYEDFQPPLMPSVLQHMESFNSAMQIVSPLTDQAWEVLKPRLYHQRDAAEQTEYMMQEQLRALQAAISNPTYQQTISKGANEAADRQWETAQVPIRKQLGKFAEKMIRGKWHNGKSLNRNSSPVFAVEVLLYARNRFVEVNKSKHMENNGPASSDPSFVSLENMRWLFDSKVRPLTEKHCRELFQCADCEGPRKAYAFEGMIQHYGAKHTTDFSKGNIVVHWQSAEWPEEPLFEASNGRVADPTLSESPTPSEDMPASHNEGSRGVHASQPLQQNLQTAQAENPTSPTYQTAIPWPGMSSASSLPQVVNTYGQHGHQASTAPLTPYPHNAQPGHDHYAYQHAQPAYQPEPTYYQQAHYPPATFAVPAAQPFTTGDQLNEIAIVAREVWDSIAGVKDLEESVRIQTVLHHVVSRFKSRFVNEPSLDMITDALANHVLMRPIKNASGIACKTCISSSLDGSSAFQSYAARIAGRKLYNISSLITHFKIVHLQSVDDIKTLDWKQDMIELPEDSAIQRLMVAVGMNDDKLATIAETFPSAFPNPLPRLGEIKEPVITSTKQEKRRTSQTRHKKNKKQKRNSGYRSTLGELDETKDEQSDALPEAAEDEYDPRRPAYVESMSHSHGRRSIGEGTRQIQPTADLSVLTPETIAALSRLCPTNPVIQKVVTGKAERSPSVPRLGGADSKHLHDQARQNRSAYESNYQASQATSQPQSGRDLGAHVNTRNTRGHRSEPSEDYTQIIRTPASGPYEQQSLSAQLTSAPPHERYLRLDPHGRPYEPPRHEATPYAYEYDPRGPPEYYSRPEYRMEHPPPVSYGYEPRPETVYVDEYGRPVEVVRVIERPMYDYPPQPDYLRRDDPNRRYVYYGQPPPPVPPGAPSTYPGGHRAEYGDMVGNPPRYG